MSDVNVWYFSPNIYCLINSKDCEMGKGRLRCVGGCVRNGYAVLVRKSRVGGRIIEVYLKDL
jgi:hypothetical protein